jgi:hypothetical protein
VTWRLKAGITETEDATIDRDRLAKHVPTAADTHGTIEELLGCWKRCFLCILPRGYTRINWSFQGTLIRSVITSLVPRAN